ncbi:GIY-YIG nuclease family protein [Actinomadura rupiterrae]|uniref:GIY-YIG nuclease family protein n=1 Tax=Actinomadura rupiterrae TaxID=559627 RepID=UPI0020A58F55|nr:GIY-YIG nuclease family protein [Actinomadura rupiterrae]MCP2339180.1 hypothetical protein [Actinomadura rupiterrae]
MAHIKGRHQFAINVNRSYEGDPEATRKRRISEAFAALGPVVYFIRDGDLIKIGHSGNLKTRRRAFTSDLTAILAVTPGDRDLEQATHERFAAQRAKRREWYHPAPELIAHINDLRAAMNVPPITSWHADD